MGLLAIDFGTSRIKEITNKTIVMKKIILFLIVAIYFSMNQKAIAQSNAAITTDELQALYNNREYEKALSYTEYFTDKKNAAALIILGDCCWENSEVKEREISQLYYQISMNRVMAMSQGIYYDNSVVDANYQKFQQEILMQRFRAIDLYSKAALLGNNIGNQRMALHGGVSGNSVNTENISNYGSTPNPQYQTKANHSLSGGRSAYQINNEIQRVQKDLNDCIQNQARANDSKSYAAAAGYNSIIANYQNRLNQLNLELSQASK